MLRKGLLQEGEVLRYKRHGKVHAVAIVDLAQQCLRLPRGEIIKGFSKFEDHAGSQAHRPCEFSLTLANQKVQDIIQSYQQKIGAQPVSDQPPAESSGNWQDMECPAFHAAEHPDDFNDEFCHICALQGDLLCCEGCPAVAHAVCLGLTEAPQGDWYCPLCTCRLCGSAAFGPLFKPPSQVAWIPAQASPPESPTDRTAEQPAAPSAMGAGVDASSRSPLQPASMPGIAAQNLGELQSATIPAGQEPPPVVDTPKDAAAGEPAALSAAHLGDAAGVRQLVQPESMPERINANGGPQGASAPNGKIAASLQSGPRQAPAGSLASLPDRSMPQPAFRTSEQAAGGELATAGEQPIWDPPSPREIGPGTHSDTPMLSSVPGAPKQPAAVASPSEPIDIATVQSDQRVLCPSSSRSFHFGCLPPSAQVHLCGWAPASLGPTKGILALAQPHMDAAHADGSLQSVELCSSAQPEAHDPVAPQSSQDPAREGCDFSGFHTAVLLSGGSLVSVALVRVLGQEAAEVPIVATRLQARNRGLARCLLTALEHSLMHIGVARIAMPAIRAAGKQAGFGGGSELASLGWGGRMGYGLLFLPESQALCSLPLLRFPGKPLLCKRLTPAALPQVPAAEALAAPILPDPAQADVARSPAKQEDGSKPARAALPGNAKQEVSTPTGAAEGARQDGHNDVKPLVELCNAQLASPARSPAHKPTHGSASSGPPTRSKSTDSKWPSSPGRVKQNDGAARRASVSRQGPSAGSAGKSRKRAGPPRDAAEGLPAKRGKSDARAVNVLAASRSTPSTKGPGSPPMSPKRGPGRPRKTPAAADPTGPVALTAAEVPGSRATDPLQQQQRGRPSPAPRNQPALAVARGAQQGVASPQRRSGGARSPVGSPTRGHGSETRPAPRGHSNGAPASGAPAQKGRSDEYLAGRPGPEAAPAPPSKESHHRAAANARWERHRAEKKRKLEGVPDTTSPSTSPPGSPAARQNAGVPQSFKGRKTRSSQLPNPTPAELEEGELPSDENQGLDQKPVSAVDPGHDELPSDGSGEPGAHQAPVDARHLEGPAIAATEPHEAPPSDESHGGKVSASAEPHGGPQTRNVQGETEAGMPKGQGDKQTEAAAAGVEPIRDLEAEGPQRAGAKPLADPQTEGPHSVAAAVAPKGRTDKRKSRELAQLLDHQGVDYGTSSKSCRTHGGTTRTRGAGANSPDGAPLAQRPASGKQPTLSTPGEKGKVHASAALDADPVLPGCDARLPNRSPEGGLLVDASTDTLAIPSSGAHLSESKADIEPSDAARAAGMPNSRGGLPPLEVVDRGKCTATAAEHPNSSLRSAGCVRPRLYSLMGYKPAASLRRHRSMLRYLLLRNSPESGSP
ncbi:hypothetical protein WJX84_000859 [Apatococcus fuscideae]|uniref:PHD-type domain-containing protein n=1 Tax=Apatococcus fuscideae TaxID=2026836 RepID=A0AAW1TCP5_9CHLO